VSVGEQQVALGYVYASPEPIKFSPWLSPDSPWRPPDIFKSKVGVGGYGTLDDLLTAHGIKVSSGEKEIPTNRLPEPTSQLNTLPRTYMVTLDRNILTSPQAWEYHIDRGRLDEARLAELGAEGWELASVVSREDTELWVFKKPKE
jgi:hypothetical protein